MSAHHISPKAVRVALATAVAVTALTLAGGASASASAPSTLMCESKQMHIVFVSGGAATGHLGLIIKFTNVSASACTLSGYPSVVMSNATGSTTMVARKTQNGYLGGLGQSTKRQNPPVIRLSAGGGVASVLVEGVDVPSGTATSCVILTKLQLKMPGRKGSYHFVTKFPACATPQVHPIVSGATGRMA